jgi:hypothetical protein
LTKPPAYFLVNKTKYFPIFYMTGLDLSQPLLGAGANARTDLAAAQARAGIDLQAAGAFKRGLQVVLGISAFANAAGEFSKFVKAGIEGTAFAEAKAGVQLQLPLNLFRQFGFAARAEAVAQAAAGVEAGLGLSIGDFILLAKQNPELAGLPLELFILFLEEVSIDGVFELNVAATAKAHASLTVSGTVIEKKPEKAGFYFTVDAGVGLAVGVGAGLKAGAEFDNFRRYYGRAVDRAVDTAISEITGAMPSPEVALLSSGDSFGPWLGAFAPIAKIALRAAYDLGLKIAQTDPGRSAGDMAALCDEAVKIFLEETQRFAFKKLLELGIASLKKSPGKAGKESAAIEAQLSKMPAEPFQNNAENRAYWKDLMTLSGELIAAANTSEAGASDPALASTLTEAAAIVYCAGELLTEAIRVKINTASVYVVAAGLGTVSTVRAETQLFAGKPGNQPPPVIRDLIRARTRHNSGELSYADLALFLTDDLILSPALDTFPELARFLSIFTGEFGVSEKGLLKIFLQNARSFDPANPASPEADPHKTLTLIVRSMDSFISEKFEREMLPLILENVAGEDLKRYAREVLFAAVVYMKDVGLRSLLNWEKRSFSNDVFTEALSGVMLLLIGRTLVVVADTLMTAAQENVQGSCAAIAEKMRSGDYDDAHVFGLPIDPDFISLAADCVEIGGEVLGPLPGDTRSRVRNLLYQVFEPVPPGSGQTFLENLADDFFIPSRDDLEQLTNELVKISSGRFALFVEKFVLKMGKYARHEIEESVRAAVNFAKEHELSAIDRLREGRASVLKRFDRSGRSKPGTDQM